MSFMEKTFGKLTPLKAAAWVFVFVLFVLFYIFFFINSPALMLYLVVFTLPPIWVTTIIGGTMEIAKIFKRRLK